MKTFTPKEIFSINLRRLRKQSGLSQEKFAVAAGLNRSYYASVERGERNVSLENIFRIAWALGREPGELLAPVSAGEK